MTTGLVGSEMCIRDSPNTEMMEKLVLICCLNLQPKSSAHSTWPHCHQSLQHFCDTAKELHKDKLGRKKNLFRHVPKMLGQIRVMTKETTEYFLPMHVLINCRQKVLVAKCTISPQSPRQRWQELPALACCGDRTVSLNELGTTVLNTGGTMSETKLPVMESPTAFFNT